MAHKRGKVFIGFEDEAVTDKYAGHVNFMTNKLGGKPDWPVDGVTVPSCRLCGLSLPLVLQVYAPLEGSYYHRTLYFFACISPNCWNQNESWVCLRSQLLDASPQELTVKAQPLVLSTSEWCPEADEWDEDAENGNVVSDSSHIELFHGDCCLDDQSCNTNTTSGSPDSADEGDDDLDMDMDGHSTEFLSSRLESVQVDGESRRDANFNASWNRHKSEGAKGHLHSPQATAEIEGDESELVTIDTPTATQSDLQALLQEMATLPKDIQNAHFFPYFITVVEEDVKSRETEMSAHVRLLLSEYKQNQGHDFDADLQEASGGCVVSDVEKYERSVPAHGDILFHHFLQQIQLMPGQILRYCREGGMPLPIAPLKDVPYLCSHCHGEMIFELQILPTIISKLKLQVQGGKDVCGAHIEFGTILVWTCQQSCWAQGDKVREERVIVQAEHM